MPHSFPVLAIDGPSASGKGTLARRLAAHYGFAYLDTGTLYRAVGLAMIREGLSLDAADQAVKIAQRLDFKDFQELFADPALRTDQTASAASKVAAVPGVRAALLKFQQDFCATPPDGKPGAVLDGRDIGTVIAPEAPVKIYVIASVQTRAARRTKELQERGENVTEAAVLADLEARDARDAGREASPAQAAADAVTLDTTHLSADAAFDAALAIARDRLGF